MNQEKDSKSLLEVVLPSIPDDKFIHALKKIISHCVRALAILMLLTIVWGIADVAYVLYTRLSQPPYFLLKISDILATFGAFLAVLIAIEIFENIILYLRHDIIHVKLVVATALMAIARKVIVFDFKELKPEYIWGTAAVI